MNYKLLHARNKSLYNRDVFLSKTIAGFIILITGIGVTIKGILFTTSPGTSTWGVIIFVGMVLIVIGIIAISTRT
jgi:uncharacterized membrane protein HdeD (DUF308 family)